MLTRNAHAVPSRLCTKHSEIHNGAFVHSEVAQLTSLREHVDSKVTISSQSAGRDQGSPTANGPPPLEASSRQYSMGHIVGPLRGDSTNAAEPLGQNPDSLAAAEAAVSTPSARTTNVGPFASPTSPCLFGGNCTQPFHVRVHDALMR